MPRNPSKTPLPRPTHRRLRGYAFDPSLATELDTAPINEVIFKLPWEKVRPGPVDEFLEVVDVDPASGTAYEPIDLNHPWVLAEDGLAPSESNPQFHQQYVYAVARTTINRFTQALGRKPLWTGKKIDEDNWEFTERLRIYPRALRAANAYYSADKKALLFGYFAAEPHSDGVDQPGGMVFTCLSHDIIVHETTHALLDGLHLFFLAPTNPDVLAFHEAFSDLVALLQHFSYPEVLEHQIARTQGRLEDQNLLGELARQFGRGIGKYGGLREYIGSKEGGVWKPKQPDPDLIKQTWSPHARGAILVSAVFNAFLKIYKRRVADLLRIASGGTGVLPQGELHPDLVNRLAREASKTAGHFLNMCIRALDYCPPVDITFGEYLRALITADHDLVPSDPYGYRIALIESFKAWGIYPNHVRNLSQDSLRWHSPSIEENHDFISKFSQIIHRDLIAFFDTWNHRANREQVYKDFLTRANELAASIVPYKGDKKLSEFLGLDLSRDDRIRVPSIRPARRVGPDGQFVEELVIEIIQRRNLFEGDNSNRSSLYGTFRGGCTLIYDPQEKRVRYSIRKPITSEDRLRRQQAYVEEAITSRWQGMATEGEVGELLALLHGLEEREWA